MTLSSVDILLLLSLLVVASIGQQRQPRLTPTQHDALTALLQFPTASQVALSVDSTCVVNDSNTSIAEIACVMSGDDIVAQRVVLNAFENGLLNGTALSALSSSLVHLEISAKFAYFKGVPVELGTLTMLTSLALRGFDDGGAVPSVLAMIKALPMIRSVEISGSFSALLADLPPGVDHVVLEGPVSGNLSELKHLTALTALTLISNAVQGDLLHLSSLPSLRNLTLSSQSVTNKAVAMFATATCKIDSCIRDCPTTCDCTIAAGCELPDTPSPTSVELSPAPMASSIGGSLTTVLLFEPPRQEEPLIGVFVGVALGVIGLLMFVIGSVVMFRDRTEPQPSLEAAPEKPPRALIKRVSSRSRPKPKEPTTDEDYVELALQPGI
jgi:hypothetical protein